MTEVLDPPLVDSVCAVLAELHRGLDALAGTDLTRLGDEELLATAGELQRLRRRARGGGRGQVRQARRLFDDPAGPLVPPAEPAPGRHAELRAEFAAGVVGA